MKFMNIQVSHVHHKYFNGYETGFPNKNIFEKTFTSKFLLDLSNYKMMNIFLTYDQEFKTVKTFFRDNKNFMVMKIF